MQDLAERILRRMSDLQMTQDELAKRTGVSQSSIHKLVSGKSKNTRFLVQIAEALECRPDWLLHGRGDMRIYAPPANNDEILFPGESVSTSTSADDGKQDSDESVSQMMTRLYQRFSSCDAAVRDEVMVLACRYFERPEAGPRILAAIDALLDIKKDK